MQEFDLIVIRSISGLIVASAAAQPGMRVAVVEKGRKDTWLPHHRQPRVNLDT